MRSSPIITALLLLSQFATSAFADSLSQVFKRVDDAVVVVHTHERGVPTESDRKPASIRGIGSGVLVEGGKVVTAAHVVQTADAVMVEFPGDVHVRASIVASDPVADVALLQLERVPDYAVTVELGDSDQAEVGDE